MADPGGIEKVKNRATVDLLQPVFDQRIGRSEQAEEDGACDQRNDPGHQRIRAQPVRNASFHRLQCLEKIGDQLKRSFFIKEVAEKYNLYESMLYGELEKSTRRVPQKFVETVKTGIPEEERAINERKVLVGEIPMEEKEILTAVLEDPKEMIPFIFGNLHSEDFVHPTSKKISALILSIFNETGDVNINHLLSLLSDDQEKTMIANITFNRYQLGERWNKIGGRPSETRLYDSALGSIKSLKKKRLEIDLAENRIQMKNAAVAGNDTMPFLKRCLARCVFIGQS